jgi:hypothetical protein
MQRAYLQHRQAKFSVTDVEAGITYGAHRPAPDGQEYWRLATFVFPFYGMSPTGGSFQKDIPTSLTAAVPMDDDHTLYVHFIARSATDHYDLYPNTSDWFGRFNAPANSANDYLLDRELQRRSPLNSGGPNFSGIPNGRHQDRAITSSMGRIYDRTHEHLGQTDGGIIRTRKRLLDAAKALAERGIEPPGVHNPEFYRVRTGELFLPEGADWVAETRDLRKAKVVASPPMIPA